MKNIDKIIKKIKSKEVKSEKQLHFEQEEIDRKFKIYDKQRFDKYTLNLKKYEKELKKIKELINIINKKYYKKYQTNVFKETSVEDMFTIGCPLFHYNISL